ncbi:MAG: trigger factor [Parabacteroides sp.]|jgi:trigger factor|nr:trigger factor [Parabacteroides sp.]MBP8758676.1 trigger factor [Parabacteroides sp.]MDD2415518.1 trigger factor [Parabacteroides sp.]MDD4404307.1 trigger factor [Parabacteroides sp.]
MNVSLKNIDAVSGIVKVEIVKADYADKVEKGLRNFRQKANVPGFRKGMVPMGMVKKMYGKSVLAEEVNKLVSEGLFGFIREKELNVLGEPLPNETEQKEINFDLQEDFEFCFDVALAPEINVELSKEDTLPYYQIAVTSEMVEKQIESYRANFGNYDKVEEVEEKDMVKGLVVELENGEPKANGLVVENAVIMPLYIKDAEEKAKFMGAKNNSVVVFNPSKAYDGTEAEIAAFLKVEKDQVASYTGDFSFEIAEITRHKEAELNEELFTRVFGEGVVSTAEEFTNKIKESLAEQFAPESDFKFLSDAKDLLVAKAGELAFPEAILKRFMLAQDERKTAESIDEDFPKVIEDLKFHLIKEKLVKENDLKVEEADITAFGKRVAKAQFAQYGMISVPEDVLDNYAKDMLKNKETLRNVIDRAVEEKLSSWLKEQVKLDVKEVSAEDFGKLAE